MVRKLKILNAKLIFPQRSMCRNMLKCFSVKQPNVKNIKLRQSGIGIYILFRKRESSASLHLSPPFLLLSTLRHRSFR
jgi:hypothetical protein